MADVVKCKVCGQPVDKTKGPYCQKPNKTGYAHVECAQKSNGKWDVHPAAMPEKVKKPEVGKKAPARSLLDDLHLTLKNHLGELYSYKKVQKELDRMADDGKTLENIAKCIMYWVRVKGQDFLKYNGSLSIIDYIYSDAVEYYRKEQEYQTLNKDTTIQSSLGDSKEVIVYKESMRKPLRVKMFNLE